MGTEHAESRPSQIQADFECESCGASYWGATPPPKCVKCGEHKLARSKAVFPEVAAAIRKIQEIAGIARKQITERKHRKGTYIAQQFEQAHAAMGRALNALFVTGDGK